MKKIVVVDFDGVIHSYRTRWIKETVIPDPPVDGVAEGIQKLRKKFKVLVKSVRCMMSDAGLEAVKKYLEEWKITVDGVVKEIPHNASLIIDDRVMTFKGDWSDSFLDQVENFKPWNK